MTNKKSVDLVTVHGTFAGDPSDHGEKWWQKGSDFLVKLQACIQEPLNIIPFHWSGRNSETDRRKASCKLTKTIEQADKPVVIGHSHGGSTGIHALAMLAIRQKDKAADALRGLLTIGTPMILFKSNRNIFTRFNLYGRILLLIALSIGLIYTVETLAVIFDPKQFRIPFPQNVIGHLGYFFRAPQPWIALIAFGLLYWYGRRNRLRQKLFRSKRLQMIFRGKYTAISHTQDEAIRALSRARTLNPKLVKFQTLFGGLFSLFAFGFLFVEFASQIAASTLSDDHYYVERPGVGTPYPRAYILATPHSPVQMTWLGMPRRGYDFVRAGNFQTREALEIYPLGDLWSEPGVAEVLNRENGAWLTRFRDTLPMEGGLLVAPADIDKVGPEFVRMLDYLRQFHPDADWPFEYFFESGEEESYSLDDLLTWHDLFQAVAAPTYGPPTDAESYRIPQHAQRWIVVSDLGRDQRYFDVFGGYDYYTANRFPPGLPVNLDFDATRLWENSCQIDPWAGFEAYPECQLLVRTENILYYKYILNLQHYKFDLFSLVPGYDGLVYRLISNPDASMTDQLNRSIAIVLLVVFASIALSALLAGILALILTPVFQGVLTATVKSTAYGNDGFGERIADVKVSLDFDDDVIGTIPAPVEEEMLANSGSDAPEALARLRALLAGAEITGLNGADPMSVATKFEKSELIHNAYFHSDRFIKYLAALLVTKYGLTPTEDFLNDEDGSVFLNELKNETA